MGRSLGHRGIKLIQEYETLSLVAYLPTPKDKWTIGFGSTRGVRAGMTITREEADRRFLDDCAEAMAIVNKLPNVKTQSMFDALVSLVFNCGPVAAAVHNTIARELKEGDVFSAWAAFALWRKQDGEDMLGLARRRAKEMCLFLEDKF